MCSRREDLQLSAVTSVNNLTLIFRIAMDVCGSSEDGHMCCEASPQLTLLSTFVRVSVEQRLSYVLLRAFT